jgi:O-antigen/teichoic acid export membrane protein
MTPRAMNFARNAQSTLFTQLVLSGLGFLLSVVLARWLSPAERGLFAVVMTFVMLADNWTQLGMRLAVIYRIGRAGVPTPRAVGASLWISLGAFVLTALAVLSLSDWLRARFFAGAPETLIWVVLLIIALEVFGGLFDAIARAIDRFDLRNLHQIGTSLLELGAAGIVLIGFGGGPLAVLLAIGGARVALDAGFYGLVLARTGLDPRSGWRELGATLSFGAQGYAQTLAAKFHERIDVLLLSWLAVDPAQIAAYAIAVSVIDRLRLVPDSIGSALLPKLAGLPQAETGGYTARVTRHSLLWICASALALAVVAPPLLPMLYGPAYTASVMPFFVLLPATVALTLRRVVANYFVASGWPGFNAGVEAVAAGINLAVNLVAIPRWGIVGAAFASLVSYGFASLVTLIGFRRQAHVPLRELVLFRRGDAEPYLVRLRDLFASRSDP